MIFYFLGCNSPIVLRAHSSGCWKIVGECYIQGMADAAIFLGPLPKPWRVQVTFDPATILRVRRYYNIDTGELRDDDPRLEPLIGWERTSILPSNRDPPTVEWFRNTVTGEVVNYDPRLLPDALRARGHVLQTIKII